MSRYFDDELAHSGVKGMKWRKHKYRLVKDANGKLRYVYDNDNKAQMFRQARAEEKDNVKKLSSEYLQKKRIVSSAKPMTESDYKVTNFNIDKDGKVDFKIRKVVRTGRSGEEKQAQEKRATEHAKKERARRIRRSEANKEQVERRKRIRQAEANKEQVERRKRLRQAEANKEQIEKRKKDQRVANNYKAKATGKRASWAPDKPYQSKVEYDQAHQSFMLKERDKLRKKGEPSLISSPYRNKSASKVHDELYKDQQRRARKSLEEFSLSDHRARAAESTARHKAAKKAQEKKYKELEARTEEAKARSYVDRVRDYQKRAIEEQDRLERYAPTTPSERRKNADEMRKNIRDLESVGYYKDGDKVWYYRGPEYYQPGLRSERIVPSKETKKRLRRNKRKKAVADTKRAIDKGRKAVEEFFTPKKKKKR